MSAYDEIKRDPSPRDLLGFGAVLLAAGLGGGVFEHFFRHREALAAAMAITGCVVFALSFIPPVGRLLYIAWMALGIMLGMITSPIVLAVVFVVLITPIALVFKVMKRDTMRRGVDKKAESYWEPYPESVDPASYLKQF